MGDIMDSVGRAKAFILRFLKPFEQENSPMIRYTGRQVLQRVAAKDSMFILYRFAYVIRYLDLRRDLVEPHNQ